MASLQLTFGDYYKQISRYLGLGSSPTGDDLTLVKDLFHKAYARVLYPVNTKGKKHTWSFLKPVAILNTQSGVSDYLLPTDFGTLKTPFTYPSDYEGDRLAEKTVAHILSLRTGNQSNEDPTCFAIQAIQDSSVGQRYKVMFWPVPASEITLNYQYLSDPPKLVNDADYPVGGVLIRSALEQMCLAMAELQENEISGPQSVEASRLLFEAIAADVDKAPDSLGYCGDGSEDYQYPSTRRLNLNTVIS